MAKQAIFEGLICDENGTPVETTTVGNEAFYVVDDDGFKRHIPSEEVDKKIFSYFGNQIKGSEDYLANMAAEMTGQNDIFAMAIMKSQLKNFDKTIDEIIRQGIPTGDIQVALGMSGFRVTIDYHGDILDIHAPTQEQEGE